MTKEKLEKEAEDIVCEMGYDTYEGDGHSDFAVRDILIKFVEPRERSIEELEKENGRLEGKFADLQSEYVELENFHHNEVNELREQNIKDCENFNKAMKEIKEQWNKEHYQLTEAKEIILKLSTCLEGHSNNNFEYELLQEAEQFLEGDR